jgi:5'-nucleotidase
MRILVTNDDGIEAPGLRALTEAALRTGNEVIVVAPLEDWSGASAAVGAFYRRDGVAYRTFDLEGLAGVQAYGVDGPPALGVILACVGGFGARADAVLSGINHGVNVGRAALHSGTVGAVLTAAQFGLRGLATSIRFGPDPVPWRTAADLVEALVPTVCSSPPGTVLNLNVPDVAPRDLKGVRQARLGRGGTIRAVHSGERETDEQKNLATQRNSAGERALYEAFQSTPPAPGGTLFLDLAIPGSAGHEGLVGSGPNDVDALLIGADFATITALVGVREASDAQPTVQAAVAAAENVVSSRRAAR